jgi:hypothetical protein
MTKGTKIIALAAIIATALVSLVKADNNIALNAPVFVVSGSAQITNPSTSLSVIDNGVFLPESTAYGSSTAIAGAVEWTTTDGGQVGSGNAPTTLEIDLGGFFAISGAIMQADNNDSYLLQYRDPSTNTWLTLWSVPGVAGFGFTTRPNADQTTFQSLSPIVTDAVRISATSGDAALGVSEIQLNGTAVPEPAPTILLAIGGLTSFALLRFRKRCKA